MVEALPVERTTLLASLPEAPWAPGIKPARVIVHLAAEPADGLDAAREAGWKPTED